MGELGGTFRRVRPPAPSPAPMGGAVALHPGACRATRAPAAPWPTPAPEPAPALAIRAGRPPRDREFPAAPRPPAFAKTRKKSQRARPPDPRPSVLRSTESGTRVPDSAMAERPTPERNPLADPEICTMVQNSLPELPGRFSHPAPRRAGRPRPLTDSAGGEGRGLLHFPSLARGRVRQHVLTNHRQTPGAGATPAPTTPASRATPGDSRCIGGAEGSKIL